jgi:hypothetical protein
MGEVFNMQSTRIAFAQASGTGNAAGTGQFNEWLTASGANANTAVWPFVRSLDWTSAFTQFPVMKGMGFNEVSHFKNAGVQPIAVNIGLAATGHLPAYSSYNASVAYVMIEIMDKEANIPQSAFTQIMGAIIPSQQFTVNANENTFTLPVMALAMRKTGSGYILS